MALTFGTFRHLALLALLVRGALGNHACDNEAGQVCPSSMGKEIGDCLKDPSKHTLTDIDGNPRELEEGEQPLELSSSCKDFIKVNEVCAAEIDEHCQGMFYHGDTMTCLTTWTKPEELSEVCKALMPKKEEDDGEVDAEKAAWRAKRKAAREQAASDIQKEKAKSSKRRRGKGSKTDL
mmetsp:Transcript_23002/g.64313  ORF Transcript_23002/g.64313 Transcript_23002/m.64313 type:complete len:179 (+) Transcript_23002:93-629(+)